MSGRAESVIHKGDSSNGCGNVSGEAGTTTGNASEALHLLEMVADWVTLHDRDGALSDFSDKTPAFVNAPRSELSGKGFIQHIHVQDRVGFLSAISECHVDGRELSKILRVLPRAEDYEQAGSYWCELQFRPFVAKHHQGSQRQVLVIGKDVTSEQELKLRLEHESNIAESNSQANSEMLAKMSHELRTPLNAIIGFSDMLQSDMYKSMCEEKRDEYVGIINNSANHLLGVVNGFLDISKIDAGKYQIFPEPFDIAAATKSTMSMLQVDADKGGIKFAVGSLDNLPEMTADRRAYVQILINVLSNAIKFTESGGSVHLKIERIGRNIKLQISDTGIGISEEHISKLGQPFYQADSKYNRKYEGTGLGLTVVHGLVELHGGSVNFESQTDKGTIVTITLPVIADIAPPVPADGASEIRRISPEPAKKAETDFTIVRKIA